MSVPPRIFIGSSSEVADLAFIVRKTLNDCTEGIVWKELQPGSNEHVLKSLLREMRTVDFAAFIYAPDDRVTVRGAEMAAPRDNVLFEMGLAVGALSESRVFVLYDSDSKPKLLSDLSGLTYFPYSQMRAGGDSEASVRAACDGIRSEIRKLGPLQREPSPRVTAPMRWGDAKEVARGYADAVMTTIETRRDLLRDFLDVARRGQVIPTKCLYYTDLGGDLWLRLCRHEHYSAYRHSLDSLRRNAKSIVSDIVGATRQPELDLISLGVGDGAKDAVLLEQMVKGLRKYERIHYFPVDINESMLAAGARKAVDGIDVGLIRVKAILADITHIHRFRDVYEYRPAPNVFALLGNTLGNNDETAMLDSLRRAMMPGDIVALEVSLVAEHDSAYLEDELIKEHDFSPFAAIGLSFEVEGRQISYHEASSLRTEAVRSVIEGTKTIVGVYAPSTHARDRHRLPEMVPLSVNHFYDCDAFSKAIEERLGVKMIGKWVGNALGLFVFQR